MNVARLPFEVGQSSGIDETAGGVPEVFNVLVDGGGANMRRQGRLPWCAVPDASGGVVGMYVFQRNVIFVTADRKIWRLHPGAPNTPIALSSADPLTQLDGALRATFTQDPKRVIIAGGGKMQTWEPTDLLSTRFVDVPTTALQDPPLPTHVTSLDNRIVANDTRFPQQTHWSNQGFGPGGHDTWPPLNLTTADAAPDDVVALHSNARELFAFGQTTLQVYAVSGSDPNLPFVSAATMTIGCIAPDSVVSFEQFFAWLDDGKHFVVSEGRSFQIISDPIALTIRGLAVVDDCVGYNIEQGKFSLLLWVFPTAKRAFYFDRDRKQWGEWRGWDGDWTGLNLGAFVYWPDRDKFLVGSATDANVYELAFGSPVDLGGGPIVMQRTTAFEDSGSFGHKSEGRTRYMLRRGQAPFGEQDVFEVTQRNDLGSFDPWARLDLGDVTDREQLVEDFPGGFYRRRQYRWRYSGQTDFVMAGAERVFEFLEAVA